MSFILLYSFEFQLDPADLNNTKNAKKEILFFNRVPKVGSQTTMELLKSLSIRNKFHYHKDKTQKQERIKLSYTKEVSPDNPHFILRRMEDTE